MVIGKSNKTREFVLGCLTVGSGAGSASKYEGREQEIQKFPGVGLLVNKD